MKPLIRRVAGVWTVYAWRSGFNSMPVLLAYLFAQRMNGEKSYTPVHFV